MLAKKYPQLKKPINCAKRMGLLESIRDYYFHRNLAKTDERMLKLQWMLDGRAEGLAAGKADGIAIGKAEGKKEGIAVGKAEGKEERDNYILNLIEQGLSSEEIKIRLIQNK